METLENLSNDINAYLPKPKKSQLILVLTQLRINNEGNPNAVSNKLIALRWIQKGYEDIMGDEERDKVEHSTLVTSQLSLLHVIFMSG